MLNHQDETARLRTQIAREYEMLIWAQTTLAEGSVKRHYIAHRQSVVNASHVQLRRLVGERQATSIIQQIMERTPKTSREVSYTKPLK